MKPPAPLELLARAEEWEESTRWERAELGRALRSLGWTYGEIREVIPVPKGTLAGWCREVQLSKKQVEAIKQRTYGSRRGVPVDTQWRRRREIKEIEREARGQADVLISNPMWVAGVMLYWGEGAKTERRLTLANSDQRLINLFIAWTRSFISAESEFVLNLNLHADNDEAQARRHWTEALDLVAPHFTKSYMKPDGTGHRKNSLPWGVCRIRVRRSADAWIRTMAWIDYIANLPVGRTC